MRLANGTDPKASAPSQRGDGDDDDENRGEDHEYTPSMTEQVRRLTTSDGQAAEDEGHLPLTAHDYSGAHKGRGGQMAQSFTSSDDVGTGTGRALHVM